MEEFIVEKGIEIPVVNVVGRKRMYPVREMEVGDSFILNGDECRANSLRCVVQREQGKKFIVRKIEENQYRCWRIK